MNISILGGGISGLSAAWFLRKKFPEAHIACYEATDRLGGSIQTKEAAGFCFEMGPRTFQTARSPLLLQMIAELHLEPVYAPTSTRYLWYQGRLRSIQSFWPQLIRMGVHDLFSEKSHAEDETIYDFATRRCGKRAAELFFDPMVKGIFAGDVHKLSMRSCFPGLFFSRSIIQAMGGQKDRGLFTIRGGMGRLIEALSKIPNEVHFHSRVDKIDGDLIVVALPAAEAARFCGIPLTIRNESMCVVNLGFTGDVLPKRGYGYLTPSSENEAVLGQIWDSSIFPVSGQTKVTTMVRGDNPMILASSALKRHLGVDRLFDAALITEAQIPQYDLYHERRIKAFETEVSKKFTGKVVLSGNYFRGASVEACIRRSSEFLTL